MSNILDDIMKKMDVGFDLVSKDGTYLKKENLKKSILKDYNKEISLKAVDPIEVSFKTYFDNRIDSGYTALKEVYEDIEALLNGEYEVEEVPES